MYTNEEKRRAALAIVTRLAENGFIALYAGGYVRDMLMGAEEESDIDIATNATPKTISELFPQTIGVGEQFGVMVVINRGMPFEVATFRSDIGINDGRHPERIVFTDAKTDALRRDFTINGMFYDPVADRIIDHVGGREDLEKHLVRAIGDPPMRFNEDYLRMLRAIRFAARFSFMIEHATWNAVRELSGSIIKVSPERIFAELDKMIRCKGAGRAIRLLGESGLLMQVLPEVAVLDKIDQPPEFHPEGDVFTHVVNAMDLLPEAPTQVLAWSVLLHDIGKAVTRTVKDRIRFNNHDRAGAEMASAVLKRLRAPNALIEAVRECVDNHMGWMNVTKMRLSTLKRFMSRPTINDELELHRIDCLASHGDISNYYFVKEQLEKMPAEEIKPEPLINGNDLISLGLKPGPLFGEILNEMYDLQLEGKVADREESLAIVKNKWIK